MIKIFADSKHVPVSWINFSDGAVTCKISDILCQSPPVNFICLNVDSKTPAKDVLFEIKLVVDGLTRMGVISSPEKVIVNMPYLPYARADRVFEAGNPLPLEMFLQDPVWDVFSEVNIVDPHNESAVLEMSSPALRSVLNIRSQAEGFITEMNQKFRFAPEDESWVIVAPDEGAAKKVASISSAMLKLQRPHEVLQASKTRDPSNGRIIGTQIPDVDLTGKLCIIVDDIADGAGTFIPLADCLKRAGAKTVVLYVTHGIFAKQLAILDPSIDQVYCSNIVGNFINHTDITEFNLRESTTFIGE